MNKGLYIHIPFCHSICSYCDFCKRVSTISQMEKYIDYLEKEINLHSNLFSNNTFDTIYIGGGTPSMIPLNFLEKLFILLKNKIDFNNVKEFTIEINPEDLSVDLTDLLVKYKVNRVSIGIQTFSEKVLLLIGRKFNFELFKQAFEYLKTKITNINLDLMYAIPTQTLSDLKDSIEKVLELNPTHLSIYSLILEEKTKLYFDLMNNKIKPVSEDLELQMVDTIHKLIFPKYEMYEISNYKLKSDNDYESIHNLKYWQNKEYLGIGISSASYISDVRFKNTESLKEYYELLDKSILPIVEKEFLSEQDKKKYELIVGLRLIKGINVDEYFNKYQTSIFDDFITIKDLIDKGYLEYFNQQLFISPKYLYVMNSILEEII